MNSRKDVGKATTLEVNRGGDLGGTLHPPHVSVKESAEFDWSHTNRSASSQVLYVSDELEITYVSICISYTNTCDLFILCSVVSLCFQ